MWHIGNNRIRDLEAECVDNRAQIRDLQCTVDRLKEELERERKMNRFYSNELETAKSAKDKGCEIGNYCRACVYAVPFKSYMGYAIAESYVCTYGKCAHFASEKK